MSELGTGAEGFAVHLGCVRWDLLHYGMCSKAKIAAFLSAEGHTKQNLEGVLQVGAGKFLCTIPLGQTQKGSVASTGS